VTLRSPQAIDDKETKTGLIFPSSDVKTNSAFYQAVAGVTEGDEAGKKTALEGTSFTPLDKISDVKAVSLRAEEIYKFSAWLMRNKDYLTYTSVSSNLPATYLLDTGDASYVDIILDSTEETQIWDNLLYQTINRSSTRMRETFIQMLVANKFAKAFKEFHDTMSANLQEGEVVVFTDQDEKEFTKRANASVVIEKEVLLSNKVNAVAPQEALPYSAVKSLQNELIKETAESTLKTLRNALKDLEREEKFYEDENKAKYKADLASHEASVDALLNDTNNFTTTSVTNPETQVVYQEKNYTGTTLPTFTFDPLPIDFQSTGDIYSKSASVTTENFLSTETQALLQSKKYTGYKSFSEIKKAIRQHIKEQEQLLVKAKEALEPKKLKVGGTQVTIKNNTESLPSYCFTGHLLRTETNTGNQFEVSIKIATGRPYAEVTDQTSSLSHPDSSTNLILNNGTTLDNSTSNLIYKFDLADDAITQAGTWEFSSDLTFANGDIVELRSSFPYALFGEVGKTENFFRFEGCGTLTNGTSPTDPVVVPSYNGIANLGIADFIRVEQEICCYVPGEVSHIESIMAKEYKEKSTRNLVSSEITTEQTRETEVENLTDTTTTERAELQSEVSSVIDQQNSRDFGANASVSSKWGDTKFDANTSFGSSSSTSTSNSNSQAQTYAQDVTERALERVVTKVSSKRTSRVLREFEENNKHGFDNTKGENHITGIYRWVDKVYKNQLVNYGKRLMYEFSIPEPSRFLKEALLESTDFESTDNGLLTPVEPKHPQYYVSDASMKFTPQYLNESNYQLIASRYNAQVNAFPSEEISVSKGTGVYAGGPSQEQSAQASFEISIPENYVATKAIVNLNFNPAFPVNNDAKAYLSVGGQHLSVRPPTTNGSATFVFTLDDSTIPTPLEISNTLAVSVLGSDVGAISCDVTAYCKMIDSGLQQWQNETFNAIMDAYFDRVNEYNDFMRSEQNLVQDSQLERMKFNPAINRSMEKRELKRCAIELLTKDTNIVLAKDRYTTTSSNVPAINTNEDLKKDVAAIKFFEQAFDWEIMAYTLYPYYYADSNNWKDLIKEPEDGDPIFQSFMQSGMARMVVPVKPGFEAAVNWYEATGEIWEGQGMVSDINDDLYLSVAEELTDPTGVEIGEPWETKVPTSLTIVQAKSAYLDEGGLPCHTDCNETSQFGETTLVISGGTGSNAADGVGADIVGTDNNVA
jgi:hypothetical protein